MERLIQHIQSNNKVRLALSTLSGILAIICWPPFKANFIILFAFVPAILAFFYSPNLKKAFTNIYITLFLFHAISMSWFSSITDQPLAWLLIYLAYLIIPFGQTLPWLLAYWIKNKLGLIWALISVPVFCVSYELFHYYWDLSYTWMHLGLAFSESPYFLKMYHILGQEGASFYIYVFNLLLASIFLFCNKSTRVHMAISTSLVILVLLPLILQRENKQRVVDSVKVAVFQPSTDPKQIYTNETIDSNFNLLKEAVEQRLDEDIDLLACPEGYFKNFHDNPIILNDPYRHNIVKKLQALSAEHGFGIITGVIVIKLYFTWEPPTVSALKKNDSLYYDTYNSAMLIEPNGNIQWRPKSRLVSFTERVPFLEVFKWLEVLHLDFTQSAGSYNYERDTYPFKFRGMVIAPLVCYESLYPDVTNDLLQRRANIIMEFSNENWTGTTNKGQKQHESYAAVNAAQFGKNYVRSTFNKGSSVIFENGEDRYDWNSKQDDFIILEANLLSGRTFYSKIRSYYNILFLFTFVLISLSLIKARAKQ